MYIKLRKVFVHTSLNHPVNVASNGFNGVRAVRSHRLPPKIDQKVPPPTPEIALFFQRSIRTLMASQKKKIFEKNASVIDDILHTVYYYNLK